MGPDLELLTPFKERINIYSGMRCFLDDSPDMGHISGTHANLFGSVSAKSLEGLASIDQLIADSIGRRTRFRSIEVSANGVKHGYSRRNANTVNPSETSPVALYVRIFGQDFRDPTAGAFTPDPQLMIRRSVLSGVAEQSRGLARQLGASDRARLDSYFTALRELEKKLEIEMQRPPPMPTCSRPSPPEDMAVQPVIEEVIANHGLFSTLLAHALACGQTQVINVIFGGVELRRAGSTDTFHTHTHEEPTDPHLGYQPQVTWFQNESLKALVTLLRRLDSIREGAQTLLDRILLLHATDVSFGRTHGLDNYPLFSVGGANGRIKTGIHVAAPGAPVTRLGLTVQQALGVPIQVWGTHSNRTTNTITEIVT